MVVDDVDRVQIATKKAIMALPNPSAIAANQAALRSAQATCPTCNGRNGAIGPPIAIYDHPFAEASHRLEHLASVDPSEDTKRNVHELFQVSVQMHSDEDARIATMQPILDRLLDIVSGTLPAALVGCFEYANELAGRDPITQVQRTYERYVSQDQRRNSIDCGYGVRARGDCVQHIRDANTIARNVWLGVKKAMDVLHAAGFVHGVEIYDEAVLVDQQQIYH
ncbi:hypothetical protein EUX98_g8362 [Antrodiella citrinella]|uniref:Uncharacterized protein n=1 Tax=Antrodiella citrinella TaxID=2447956 RepID=A0A4S4M8L2_9APHY|nr:hypothetical protein EUX98_g8362 [Antrodiella citrinella]